MNRWHPGAGILVLCAGAAATGSAQAVCFVNGNLNSGFDNGISWPNAYRDLQSALNNAACTEIWVARAVYRPSTSLANVSFNVGVGVAVYGGFLGVESQRSQRDPIANLTVLSGDLTANDCGGGGCADGVVPDTTQISPPNTNHVVFMNGHGTPMGPDTVLDGFTITGGDSASSSNAGGIYCGSDVAQPPTSCSPTLANLVLVGNRSSYSGGGLFVLSGAGVVSSPTLNNVVFRHNQAGTTGGGMYCGGSVQGTSSPHLSDVTFDANSAVQLGGAMYNDGAFNGISSPVLVGVTFSGNSAPQGGAMFNAGAGGTSSPELTNVTFSGNSATQYGGAMFNSGDAAGVSSPVLDNVTFHGNSATLSGGGLYTDAGGGTSEPVLTNVVLWGDTAGIAVPEVNGNAIISKSIVQGGCPAGSTCSNLVVGDPRLGALRDNGGRTQTLMLGFASAAIDTGSDAGCPVTDQRGIARFLGLHCDIGAVESDGIFDSAFE